MSAAGACADSANNYHFLPILLRSQLPQPFEQGKVRGLRDRLGGKAQKEKKDKGWDQRDWF